MSEVDTNSRALPDGATSLSTAPGCLTSSSSQRPGRDMSPSRAGRPPSAVTDRDTVAGGRPGFVRSGDWHGLRGGGRI